LSAGLVAKLACGVVEAGAGESCAASMVAHPSARSAANQNLVASNFGRRSFRWKKRKQSGWDGIIFPFDVVSGR
jgi:hypothetical protein